MSTYAQRMVELRLADAEKRLLDEKRRNEMLKGRLVALDADAEDMLPEWAEGLRPAHIAVMEAFLNTYPRIVTLGTLDDLIPKRDHAMDRCDKIVQVYICQLRKIFGPDVIKNVWGKGYRCGEDFYAKYGKKTKKAA